MTILFILKRLHLCCFTAWEKNENLPSGSVSHTCASAFTEREAVLFKHMCDSHHIAVTGLELKVLFFVKHGVLLQKQLLVKVLHNLQRKTHQITSKDNVRGAHNIYIHTQYLMWVVCKIKSHWAGSMQTDLSAHSRHEVCVCRDFFTGEMIMRNWQRESISGNGERETHPAGLLQEELEGVVDGLKCFQFSTTKGYEIILHMVVHASLQTLKTHRTQILFILNRWDACVLRCHGMIDR